MQSYPLINSVHGPVELMQDMFRVCVVLALSDALGRQGSSGIGAARFSIAFCKLIMKARSIAMYGKEC